MSSELTHLGGLVGNHQAFYYDLAKQRITVTPASQIDEVLHPDMKGIRPGTPVVFEGVSDIAISSQDNVVIGQCLSCVLDSVGVRHRCRMTFDDFGSVISVSFSFVTFSVVSSPP